MPSFDGTKLRIKVTDELVIVSNADGLNPGIYFFDYNLEQIEYIPRSRLAFTYYNLEVYDD